jgi:hypothetical protein
MVPEPGKRPAGLEGVVSLIVRVAHSSVFPQRVGTAPCETTAKGPPLAIKATAIRGSSLPQRLTRRIVLQTAEHFNPVRAQAMPASGDRECPGESRTEPFLFCVS